MKTHLVSSAHDLEQRRRRAGDRRQSLDRRLGLRSLGRLKVRRRWAMVVRGVWEWRDEAGLVSS